ncbi:hypothetical protein [Burkholderia sp. Bp9131]|uniref:hypothetical protein n=1 Tax=Burkholderia sp. Bp9131 TaxID=2184571 RepID=UPI000F55D28F|nr:hypothetical protein [Burkholderia sp. Bp9131]
MTKLILVWILIVLSIFALSLVAVGLVKVVAAVVVSVVYGGRYVWSVNDVYSILKDDALCGGILSVFMILAYRKTMK